MATLQGIDATATATGAVAGAATTKQHQQNNNSKQEEKYRLGTEAAGKIYRQNIDSEGGAALKLPSGAFSKAKRMRNVWTFDADKRILMIN